MIACRLANKDFDFNVVDLAKDSPKNANFLAINPTNYFPFIEDGSFRVMAGNHVIYIFLAKNTQEIGKSLLPEELDIKIKGVIGWEQAKLAIPCQ